MQTDTDGKLISQLQQGDLEALGGLFDRHQRMVYRTALAITGEQEAAADLLQDVFLRLHRFVHRVDTSRPLEPWLYRVTVNQACTWVKRRRWMRPIEEIGDWLVGDNSISPATQVEMKEIWRQVERALARLPLLHRTVIVLYYINELSVTEIAEILEIPTGTVKSRLHYGRQALRAELKIHEEKIPEVLYEFT